MINKIVSWVKTHREVSIISAAGVVLAVLMIVLIALPGAHGDDEDSHDHSHGGLDDVDYNYGDDTLINYPVDMLTQVGIQNPSGTFTLIKEPGDGASRDAYSIAELAGLPVDVDFIRMAWPDAAQVGYSYALREHGELPQYGLDPPVATVAGRYSDGSESAYFVGDSIPGDENNRYFMVTGDDRVYVGYINYAFLAGAGYWLMIDPYGDGRAEAEITALTVSGEGFPQPSVIIKQDTADESDPFYSCKYVMISPFLWGCDDYSLSELTYELGSLRADVAVCPFPNEADMKKYGLGAPRYVVTFTRDGIDYTLRCSAKFGGVFYVIFDSIPVIYQLNTEAYFKLADMSQTSILAASPRVLNFKTVASLSVTGRGQSFAFTVARTPISADQTLFEYRVSSGGKEIGLSGFKNLLQTINESTVVEFGALAVSEEPELKITVAYHPEYERAEEVLRYYPTANRRFVCDINGQRIGAVQSLWIDRVFSGAQTAAENSEN